MKIIYVACKHLECRYIGSWEQTHKALPYCRKAKRVLNETINCSNCIEFTKKK